MKATKEFRTLSEREQKEKLEEFKKELLKLNVQVAAGGGAATNTGKLRQTKKNIARIITLRKMKEVKSK